MKLQRKNDNEKKDGKKLKTKNAKKKKQREPNKPWMGHSFRAERREKSRVYQLCERFLARNPLMSWASLFDLALTKLFADVGDPECQVIYRGDITKLKPDFSLKDEEK